MQIFVIEAVTGGALAGQELTDALINEGTLMRDALIGDLEDVPGLRVVTAHDSRLPPPARGESVAVSEGDDPYALWSRLAAQSHCAWPIAPESKGALARLVALLTDAGARVIGPNLETVELCSSKQRTSDVLSARGVKTVRSYPATAVPSTLEGPFVIKPDDGAGCIDTRVFEVVPDDIATRAGYVVETYVPGEAASLTVLCRAGLAHVLAANRQMISLTGGQLEFLGVEVGGIAITDDLRRLASRIHAALPGLSGFVGVDYVATEHGPVIVELNPRLTTSYVGLRRALGVNPAAFVGELIREGTVPDLPHMPVPVPVEVRL